jgi:N4-gp56 family major capsid protein
MSFTNFARLTDEELTIWSMDLWKAARNKSFLNRFAGSSSNSMVQHITELTKTDKGARAVITLLADLEGDGVAGDRTLEGNEEAMKSHDQVIRIDQLRHANRHEGRMADQKSVLTFRNNSKDVLGYWLADRMDQVGFLALSGVALTQQNNGAVRVGSDLPFLEFAADIAAPTTNRVVRWDSGNSALVAGGTTASVVAGDRPSWEMLVQLKAFAKESYVRGIQEDGGEEAYHVFMTPTALSKLKLDTTYMAAVRDAGIRSNSGNPLFAGNTVKVDGLYIHEFRHVYNTSGATSGVNKWGTGSDIDGCQMLFCGAQALGMADIGNPYWVEEGFDYQNQQGISVGKIFGLLKPKFNSLHSGTTEDFGVISCYVSQQGD